MTKLLRLALPFFALLSAVFVSQPAWGCYACGNALRDWGTRSQVCEAPSSSELDAMLACMRSGSCATPCADWIASFDACEESGDPACAFDLADDSCNGCVEDVPGCGAEAAACGSDATGCVTCAGWLGGGDPWNLCPVATDPAIALSVCACRGGCADACASACGAGYLEVGAASSACSDCFGGDMCSAEFTSCSPPLAPLEAEPAPTLESAVGRCLCDADCDDGVPHPPECPRYRCQGYACIAVKTKCVPADP